MHCMNSFHVLQARNLHELRSGQRSGGFHWNINHQSSVSFGSYPIEQLQGRGSRGRRLVCPLNLSPVTLHMSCSALQHRRLDGDLERPAENRSTQLFPAGSTDTDSIPPSQRPIIRPAISSRNHVAPTVSARFAPRSRTRHNNARSASSSSSLVSCVMEVSCNVACGRCAVSVEGASRVSRTVCL
jgi:hypothetical protein